MSKAAPWSIKGVDFDAREAAREAAHREGMTLGEWLNEVIADRAAEMGAVADDLDEDDRLEAISSRLSRIREGGDRVRRRTDRKPVRDRDEELEPQPRPRRRAVSRTAAAREVSWRDQKDAETLLENAIDAFERRTSRSQAKTARALADVAELIENSHSRSERESETLDSISRRLEDIEQQVSRRPDAAAYRPIRGALTRLEGRIETMSKQRDGGHANSGFHEIDAKLDEIAERLDVRRERPGDEQSDRLARIEAQIAALAAQPEPRAVRSEPAPFRAESARRPLVDAVSQIAQRQRELDGDLPFTPRRVEPRPPFDMRRGPSEMETRLASIVERLEKRLPTVEEQAARPDALAGLQGDISRMAQHIEKMREDFARRPGAAPEIDALRGEVAAVSRGLTELAPRASVSSLERAMRDIADRLDSGRLDASRLDGVRDAVATPIEQLSRELRAGLRELDPRAAIGALEQNVRAISAKLESLESRGGVEPKTIRAIYEQTRDVRDLLARAAKTSFPTERTQRELAELADRIDNGAAVGAAPADIERIIGDVRAVVAESLGASGLHALEERVERLSDRIDAALAAGSTDNSQMAAFGDRLDKLHRAVAQNLAAPRTPPAADTQHLEQLVRDLADKVDRAADPGAGREELIALHSQIDRLSRTIERSNGRDETVASLERMISDLFGQLDETRRTAMDAAEHAARNAARETMREALANAPQPAPTAEFSREIAALRSVQDTSDERTHATLKAVHETLERVVDRLATLEGDIAETRSAAQRAPAFAEPPPQPVLNVAPPVAAKPAPAAPVVRDEAAVESEAKSGSSMSVATALARIRGGGKAAAAPAPAVEAPRPSERKLASPAPGGSIDDDLLIEPGAGRRRPAAVVAAPPAASMEAAEPSTQAGFIAAARRAAMAAQAASAASVADEDAADEPQAGGRLAQIKSVYEKRRKPILLSLAALIGLLGALQIAKVYVEGGSSIAPPPAVVQQPKAEAPAPEARPAAAVEVAPPAAVIPPPPIGPRAESVQPPADLPKPPSMVAAPQGQPPRKIDIVPAPGVLAPPPPPASATTPGTANPHGALGRPRADAGNLDPAPVGAIERQDNGPATLSVLQAMSAQGDAAAQYELAARHADGNQAPRDLKLAAQLFEKSATKGLAPSQYRLGVLYERGLGVARDPAIAKLWYQRAAERGNVRAMHNLAVLIADGGGAKPDYAEAAIWFRRAAEYGVKDSQYNLAILYARGLGGPQDMTQSYAWFSAAAAQGDEDSGKKRDEIANRLDAKTLARAKELAVNFRAKQPEQAVNEVTPPPGGWQPAPARGGAKSPSRPKVTQL